jgi:3D (Asp-Asp-Asp) domain-containing protein
MPGQTNAQGSGTHSATGALVGRCKLLLILGITLFAPFAAFPTSGKFTATVTAYCACVKCCHQWSGGPTASGKSPQQGITVAGPRWLKFGTRIHIEGIGERVVEDRLARKYDGRFDVFFKNHDEALRFGKKRLLVTIK